MKRIILFFALASAIFLFGGTAFAGPETISLKMRDNLSINTNGSVKIEQTEIVPNSPLRKVFERRSEEMSKEDDTRQDYIKELKKRFYHQDHDRLLLCLLRSRIHRSRSQAQPGGHCHPRGRHHRHHRRYLEPQHIAHRQV
jgi:hypothetical protein